MEKIKNNYKIPYEVELYLYEKFWKKLEETLFNPKIFEKLTKLYQEVKELGWYDIREYDLSIERDNEFISGFPSEGDIIIVLYMDGLATIRIDSEAGEPLDLEENDRLRYKFTNLWLSNTSQSGKKLKLLFGKGDFDLEKRVKDYAIGEGETEMTGEQIVQLLEALSGTSRLSADAIKDGEDHKMMTAAEREKLANQVNKWNYLTGSLDNEQYVPIKDKDGNIIEVLSLNKQNQVIILGGGDDIIIELSPNKNLKVRKKYF